MAFPKKKILYTVGALVVLGGTNFATYYVTDRQASKSTEALPAGKIIPIAGGVDKSADTLSPQNVALSPQLYENKQIKVQGIIVPSPDNTYSIVDAKTDKPLGLKLDPGSSEAAIKGYAQPAASTTDQKPEPTIVTVDGTLKSTKNDNGSYTYKLSVSSVKK